MSIFIEQTVKRQAPTWADINWRKVERNVKRLQERIYRATEGQDWKRVRSLQKLLARAMSNKLLAIRRVTQENQGRHTPGVDGVVYDTPKKRMALSQEDLDLQGHHPQPVRRVYIPKTDGKKRPLGIPTQKDRVRQAIVKASLEPEWEARFEANSYGFRPGRRAMDAMEQLHTTLNQANSSAWILDADISGCFDHISHSSLLGRIPVFRTPIRRWLKAGVVEMGHYTETETGTPQGGIISPLLANIALDGLERLFGSETRTGNHIKPSGRTGRNKGISLIRFADDFVVVAPSKEVIVEYVLPRLKEFLAKRGLSLNQAKTRIVHGDEGFNFLGFHIRRYGHKLLIKPQKEKVQQHLAYLKHILTTNRQATVEQVVYRLNPVIWGWANYYRHCAAKETLVYVQYRLGRMLWQWVKRRHPNKSRQWLKERYYKRVGNRNWVFGNQQVTLRNPADMPVRRYAKVRGRHSPYDPKLRHYWARRQRIQVHRDATSKLRQSILRRQNYQCGYCGLPFKPQEPIHYHHRIPVAQGGTDGPDNRLAVHQHCHYQVHHRHS